MAEMITMAEHYRKMAEIFRVMADKTDATRRSHWWPAPPCKIFVRENFLLMAEIAEEKAGEYD